MAETVTRPVSEPWNQLAGQDQLSRTFWEPVSCLQEKGHAQSRAGRQKRMDGGAAARDGTWLLPGCQRPRDRQPGYPEPGPAPTASRGAAPPSLPSSASLTNKAAPGPLWDHLERTKHLSVHVLVVGMEKLACDQEQPDTRVLARSQNQEHGATLRGSEGSEGSHDTDSSSWSCKTD